MNSSDNSTSPILERLRNLSKLQEECRVRTSKFIANFQRSQNSYLSNSLQTLEKDDSNAGCSLSECPLNADCNHVKCSETVPSCNVMDLCKSGMTDVASKLLAPVNSDVERDIHDVTKHPEMDVNINSDDTEATDVAEQVQEKENIKYSGTGKIFYAVETNLDTNDKQVKFPYLRKGQGTARYHSKTLKGFRKKNSRRCVHLPVHELKLKNVLLKKKDEAPKPLVSVCQKSRRIHSVEQKEISNKLSTFEKLEEIVEHDSFVSTSSVVQQLLQEDNSMCVSPVLQDKLADTVNTTIYNRYKNLGFTKVGLVQQSSIHLRRSPVRELFCEQNVLNLSPVMRELKSVVQHDKIGTQFSQHAVESGEKSEKCLSGILKKDVAGISEENLQNQNKPYLSVPKVQFLHHGAKVLEYDDESDKNITISTCSEDSDLISLSDLENLALLNYDVHLSYVETPQKGTSASDQVSRKAYFNCQSTSKLIKKMSLPNKSDISESEGKVVLRPVTKNVTPLTINELHTQRTQAVCASNSTSKRNHLALPNNSNVTSDSRHSSQSSKHSYDDDDDIEAHKLLLLAKVNELNKEIKLFKSKNETMEELIKELKKNKKELVQLQAVEKQRKIQQNRGGVNSRTYAKNWKAASTGNEVVVSEKLQQLNEKLCHLETENNLLKRKVNLLERKERELKHNQKVMKEITETNTSRKHNPLTHKSSLRRKPVTQQGKREQAVALSAEPRRLRKVNFLDDEMKDKNMNQGYDKKCEEETDAVVCYEKPAIELLTDQRLSPWPVNSDGANSSPHFEMEERFLGPENIDVERLSSGRSRHERGVVKNRQNAGTALSGSGSLPTSSSDLCIPFPNQGFLKTVLTITETLPAEGKILQNSVEHHQEVDCDISLSSGEFRPHKSVAITGDVTSKEYKGRVATAIGSSTYHPNGDIETEYDDRVVYFYSKEEITRTLYVEGKEIIEFPNGQTEIYFPDGSQQIIFTDGSCTSIYKDGTHTTISCDGTKTFLKADGTKIVEFPNGQKEVYYPEEVHRIYPDGTIKILYNDGRQETRYQNGRIRIKDKEGNVLT